MVESRFHFMESRILDDLSRSDKIIGTPVCGLIMYYTYILKSKRDNSYYIGYTQNLNKRISEHNSGKSKSTKSRRPYELIYRKGYETRSEAVRYERYLKSLKKREYLEKVISC